MAETIAEYGYLGLFLGVLADQIGVPMPSMLLVLAAGALAGLGELNMFVVIGLTMTASAIGDQVWFEFGKRRGIRVLGFLCKMSLERDSCVRDTQETFVRRGSNTLLFAKFVPGLATIAPPLAGIVGMSNSRFLIFNSVGTLIWAVTFAGLGFVFSDAIEAVANYASEFGTLLLIVLLAMLVAFIGFKFSIRRRFLKNLLMARISPVEVMERIQKGDEMMIVDLRHTLEFEANPRLLPGAVRLSLDEIEQRHSELPRDRDIVLYCSCPNEASSASVAIKLHKKGITRVRPLEGGINAWESSNFPLEPIDNEIHPAAA